MADAIFNDPRLASICDSLDADRSDLDVYLALVEEVGARSVLDIGCGTGTFACLLAQRGIVVTAVDPAAASIGVARRKPFADRVNWLVGDTAVLQSLQVDMATMTANVAQVFLTDQGWASTLQAAHAALRPGGHLIFETRVPARKRWRDWDRGRSYRRLVVDEVGPIEAWVELTDVNLPFVSFEWTFVFERDQTTLRSASTLRFRDEVEIGSSLSANGFMVEEVRDAPDRPGDELVLVARSVAGNV